MVQPGMVFATFPPGMSKPEMAEHVRRYQGMLQSGAIRTSIFQTGERQWCITTYRSRDTWTVVEFLHEQKEVMMASHEYRDVWQLREFFHDCCF